MQPHQARGSTGGASHGDQQRPVLASDIPLGDWVASKQELGRVSSEQDAASTTTNVPTSPRSAGGFQHSQRRHDPWLYDDSVQTSWREEKDSPPSKHRLHPVPQLAANHPSCDESPEGRSLWSHPRGHREPPAVHHLLDVIRSKLLARYDSLHESFLKFDVDRSGYISEDKFRHCLANMGLDVTGEEMELLQRRGGRRLGTAFKAADKDGSIDLPAFTRLLTEELDVREVDSSQIRTFFSHLDTNNDAKLSYSEFVKCLEAIPPTV
ncbi:hypothetical protein H257_06442 [Aphanomyces astaci]|uniref:EF-hand domain-containing protein n=1 Tax=Aphanomyces astaci TaxID=112090 RepID=W4GMV0_APHAT|nr:hypothetical protein H257_06442 [Aphanomyces astaci]ETV81007.1 hypothetical protein H257_06442 [Aphanomyces astaci]|eukprot:XP_009829954.1 hypothetical protein H257_06442 [Aphanomyces astaci]